MSRQLRSLMAEVVRFRNIRWRERAQQWIDTQESTPELRRLEFTLLVSPIFWPEPDPSTPRHRRR